MEGVVGLYDGKTAEEGLFFVYIKEKIIKRMGRIS